MNKQEQVLQQIPIFFINLKRSKERRKRMEFQLNRLHLEYTIFEAIDGSQLSKQVCQDIEKNRNPLIHAEKFTLGEIGCGLTHLALYQHIITHKIEKALVLEDDVFLEEKLTCLIKESTINQMPKSWDLLLCAYVQKGNVDSKPYRQAHMQFAKRKVLIDKHEKFKVGKSVYFCLHAAGYIVSYEGARKLLAVGSPMSMPADLLTGNAHVYDIHNYVLQKPCIRQHSIWALDSTIKITHDSQVPQTILLPSIKSKQLLKKFFKNFMGCSDSKNIFIRIITDFVRVYCFLKYSIINMARGYGFFIRTLRKLKILPIQKMFDKL